MNTQVTNQLTSEEEKKLLNRVAFRSNPIMASFNMMKMLGVGFGYALFPFLNAIYKNDEEERRAALSRHTGFFNTTYALTPLVLGIVAGMEKQRSIDKDSVDSDTILNIKASLMGPLAGIGDALFLNTLRVIASGVGISLASQGNILGPIIFFLIYAVPFYYTKYKLTFVGYNLGEEFVTRAYESGLANLLTKAAGIVGLMMVGSLTASTVNVTTALELNLGGGVAIELQEILDQIMPGILPLLVTFGVVGLLKKMSSTKIILLLLVLGVIGKYIGFF